MLVHLRIRLLLTLLFAAPTPPPPPPSPPLMTAPSTTAGTTADFSDVPTLPADTPLTYLAEGAANIIYRSPALPFQLLRLRKALPSAQPNALAYTQLLRVFHPMLPAHLLLPTSLVRIPPAVIRAQNKHLRAREANDERSGKRSGLYLEDATEEFGFLIQDMSAQPLPLDPPAPSSFLSRLFARLFTGHRAKPQQTQQTRQLLIEFKPKWVVQSPSAPPGWRRCRTCALRLSKSHPPTFCPLDLSSGDESRVRRAASFLIPATQPASLLLRPGETWSGVQVALKERIVRFLVDSELMGALKELHIRLDPHGPVGVQTMGKAEKERFVAAMTVRDLTIFLRVDLDAGVEAKIGDLDVKTGDAGKWAYWEDIERKLIDGGWYAAIEKGAEEKGIWCTSGV